MYVLHELKCSDKPTSHCVTIFILMVTVSTLYPSFFLQANNQLYHKTAVPSKSHYIKRGMGIGTKDYMFKNGNGISFNFLKHRSEKHLAYISVYINMTYTGKCIYIHYVNFTHNTCM